MGVCFGTPDFPTPSATGNPKSGAKWDIATSSSSAASNSHDRRPILPTLSSSAASYRHDRLSGRTTITFSAASNSHDRLYNRTTLSSSAASSIRDWLPVRIISSSAASNSHALLAAHDKKAFGDGKIAADASLTIFSFAELIAATKIFPADALLGKGGFGCVYKGMLPGKQPYGSAGTIIAVKILNPDAAQGHREWMREIVFIGKISHPNLAKLLGFCRDNENLALVYEFMPMGSLENQLFGNGSTAILPWDVRLKIMVGAARGLAFLHNSCNMIHRNFKTTNILLDGFYMAKVSDFGLVRSSPPNKSHVSTQFMDTYGYAAPEYRTTGHLTVESNVYSFGVVLLEILTGLRALDLSRPAGKDDLVEWVRPHLHNERKLRTIMDSRLEGENYADSAPRIAQLAYICLQQRPRLRPPMSKVVEELESLEAAIVDRKLWNA